MGAADIEVGINSPDLHAFEWEGNTILLTQTELKFALIIQSKKGRVLTQPQILQEVWGLQHDPGTNRVAVLVNRLRNKLGDRFIHSVHGVGYVHDPDR